MENSNYVNQTDFIAVLPEVPQSWVVVLSDEITKLRSALRTAISEADGWCGESRGEPCHEVDHLRELVESGVEKQFKG